MLLKKICWTNVAQEKSMVCIPEPGETNSLSLGLVKIEMAKYVSLFLFLELHACQERIDVLCTLVLPHVLAFEPLVYGGPSGEVFREFICIAPEIYLVHGNSYFPHIL